MIDFFDRLDTFMKYKDLNDNKITVEAGISNGLIGKARQRGALSQESISKILYKYPELNANWLLTGKGLMLHPKEDVENVPNSNNHASINTIGSRNVIQGNDNSILESNSENLKKCIEIIKKQQEQMGMQQEQMGELINIIKKR